jgi:hypothetical protein
MSDENYIEIEASKYLRLSPATLRRRRLLRQKPVWVKLGARVVYRKSDLDAFIQENVVEPEVTKTNATAKRANTQAYPQTPDGYEPPRGRSSN